MEVFRQPASFCGVVGLKPTLVEEFQDMDLWHLLNLLIKLDPLVRYSSLLKCNLWLGIDYDAPVSSREVSDYTEFLGKEIKGMKIGVPKEYFIDRINENVRKVVDEALGEI